MISIPKTWETGATTSCALLGVHHVAMPTSNPDVEIDRISRGGVRFDRPPSVSIVDMPIRALSGSDPEGNVFGLPKCRGETLFDYAPSSPEWEKKH